MAKESENKRINEMQKIYHQTKRDVCRKCIREWQWKNRSFTESLPKSFSSRSTYLVNLRHFRLFFVFFKKCLQMFLYLWVAIFLLETVAPMQQSAVVKWCTNIFWFFCNYSPILYSCSHSQGFFVFFRRWLIVVVFCWAFLYLWQGRCRAIYIKATCCEILFTHE